MTSPAPTFSQIKAQVAAIRHKFPEARVVGIRAQGRWTGERCQQDGNERYVIAQCDSPLAVRLALRNPADANTTTVLITSLAEQELGDDILVRLTKRRLFQIDSWQIVKTLFQARAVDPRVARLTWIAESLLDAVPPAGFPPAPGGFLDAETVWPILLRRQIGFVSDQPDLLALLTWSIDADNVARWQTAARPFRQAAIEWLSQQIGPSAQAILDCVESNSRPDALAIGLAAGVVFNPETQGRLEKAAGKLEERYLGGKTSDPAVIERWYAAAMEVVGWQLTDSQRKRGQLTRADEILAEVQADAYAYVSNTSPLGFDQRLARFGQLLSEAVRNGPPVSLDTLTAARQRIAEHEQAQHERRRLDRTAMAVRLVQWLTEADADAPFSSLPDAAAYQVAAGSFVDWARLRLRAGDPVRELSEAYARLFDLVTARREQQASRFASLLRDWTAAGSVSEAVILVERILDEIVAPLASQAPVLVIVVDGMSAAVGRELMTDITQQDWVALCEDGRTANRPGLATIPSVTDVSRTSLLCGRLQRGDAAIERNGFAAHPGLLAHCRSGFPPIVFHKPALQEADDTSLAAEVRQAIGSSQRRIVGVIINAVDDHLLKGEQLDTRWSRDEIKMLPTLLHEAKAARRLVVLLADHGHVVEHQTQGRLPGQPSEGGERWRRDDGNPALDEVQLAGDRVVIAGHQLIAPWTEKVHYGVKKNGYHGGVSPQEMVVPISVLGANTTVPAGWHEGPIETPAWWDEALPQEQIREVREVVPVDLKPKKPKETKQLGPLFEFAQQNKEETVPPSDEAPISDWIQTLLTSPLLREQKKLAGRTGPADAIIVELLTALDRRGGKLTSAALARAIDYPALRLPGLLAVMQRMLNIDGYAVLTRDEASDTIELNRELLRQQFDV